MNADHKQIEGGYALYRRHCLHCHGVSGGDGPTAPFLYRPPRLPKGIFKFTSTPSDAPPSRRPRRTIPRPPRHVDAGVRAPPARVEIEQVVDYVIFLSMRGETELALIEEAAISGEKDAKALSRGLQGGRRRLRQVETAESQVINPHGPELASTRESILRGRDLFLGLNKSGNEGRTAHDVPRRRWPGDGPSFVKQDVFNDVVFGGDPLDAPWSDKGHGDLRRAEDDDNSGSKNAG